jgi:diadenosine tetraphosphate (Ap4A) HIT family hydrolase
VVHEDETVVAFMDLSPVTPGHLLVVPRKHAAGLEDLDRATSAHVWSAGHDLARALRRSSMRPEGINVFLCDGYGAFFRAASGQVRMAAATAPPPAPPRRE